MLAVIGAIAVTFIAVALSYLVYGFTMLTAFSSDLTPIKILIMLLVITFIWYVWWGILGVHVHLSLAS